MAERSERAAQRRLGRGALVVAGISLLWFAGTLWFTHNAASARADPSIALIDAALALPLLIAAGLVAGAAGAVVVVDRLAARGRVSRVRWPSLAGAGVGLVLGAAAGGLILIGYGTAAALVSLRRRDRGRGRRVARPAASRGRPWWWPGWSAASSGSGSASSRACSAARCGTPSRPTTRWPPSTRRSAGVSFAVALLGGAVAGLTASLYLRRTRPDVARAPGGRRDAGPAAARRPTWRRGSAAGRCCGWPPATTSPTGSRSTWSARAG